MTFDKVDQSTSEKFYTYDELGNVIVCVDDGISHEFKYDGFGREIGNDELTKEYDFFGNLIWCEDRCGRVTRNKYGMYKDPIETIFPDQSVERREYFDYGKTEVFTDALGNVTETRRDAVDRIVFKKVGEREWKYEYPERNVTKLTDPLLRTEVYRYDKFGRLISETGSLCEKIVNYDALGYLCRVQENGLITECENDARGRIVYQKFGKKITNFKYDSHDRVIEIANGTGFDPPSRKMKFNGFGQIMELINEVGQIWKVSWHGREKIITDPKGRVTRQLLDEKDRPLSLTKLDSNSSVIQKEEWKYNSVNERVEQLSTVIDGSESHTNVRFWEYDSRGRVLQLTETLQEVEGAIERKFFLGVRCWFQPNKNYGIRRCVY